MKQKVIIRGPALTRSGYGEHVRFILRSLRQLEDKLDLYLIPVNWGRTGWIMESSEEREWIDAIVKKTHEYVREQSEHGAAPFDISIQVTIPNEWERIAPVNIGITAGIETTRVAPEWINKGNDMDLIIVPSQHSKQVYAKTSYTAKNEQTGEVVPDFKCTTPIEVLSYPVKDFADCDIEMDFSTEFNFINISQWAPRKDVENCVLWFVEEFIDLEVGMVLKTNIAKNCLMDKRACRNSIRQILSHEKFKDRKCKIYLLHGDMTDQEIHQLYRHPKIKAFVTTTHGEGFGLPLFESAYEGLPVIAPDWSGHLDFLYMPVTDKKGKTKNKAKFSRMDYTLQPIPESVVWDGVLQRDSMWAQADEASFKVRLREVYKDYGRFKKQATELQGWLKENLSPHQQNLRLIQLIDYFITDEEGDEFSFFERENQ